MLSNTYAHRRIAQIDKRLAQLTLLLATLPEGRLSFSKSRGKTQFYQLIGLKGEANYSRKYLGSSSRDIAIGLAKKALYNEEYECLQLEKKSLFAMLKIQEGNSVSTLNKLKQCGDDFSCLLHANSNNEINTWTNSPFYTSAPNQEARIVRAIDGTFVRSKSESEIISLLVKYNIPYRYECDLIFNDRVIGCPDFTIMHPSTHEIFIWEHFGLLDNLNYVRRNIYKVQHYIEAGYFPMINFIITSETATRPFDITLADSLIRQFFLQ